MVNMVSLWSDRNPASTILQQGISSGYSYRFEDRSVINSVHEYTELATTHLVINSLKGLQLEIRLNLLIRLVTHLHNVLS